MEGLNGKCYCGRIQYQIKEDCDPFIATYCHCESCRRAHAAPVYHVVYVKEEDFRVTRGLELLTRFRMHEGTMVTRAFCSVCGTRIMNILHNKPWFGFFPATLYEDTQQNLPDKFQPTLHYCGDEAVIDVFRLDPALPVVGSTPLSPASSS